MVFIDLRLLLCDRTVDPVLVTDAWEVSHRAVFFSARTQSRNFKLSYFQMEIRFETKLSLMRFAIKVKI